MYKTLPRSGTNGLLEVSTDNTLILKNIQRHHEGNYSCFVRNNLGTDQIVYQIYVQVPPGPPDIRIVSINVNAISLEWQISGEKTVLQYMYNLLNNFYLSIFTRISSGKFWSNNNTRLCSGISSRIW